MIIRRSLLILITFWVPLAHSLGFPEKAIQLVPNEQDAFLMQTYAHPRETLIQAIDALSPGARLLLFAPIDPTFEDKIFEAMSQEISWKGPLASYAILTADDYRQIVREKNCTIHHLETQKGLAHFEDLPALSLWLTRDLTIPFQLTPSETTTFIDEAFFHLSHTEAFQNGQITFPYRRLLLLIEKGRSLDN